MFVLMSTFLSPEMWSMNKINYVCIYICIYYCIYRPPVRKPNHCAKINFLTSATIFHVSLWGKKHSKPIKVIEIYLNQFKLCVYLLFSSVRNSLKLKIHFGLVWGCDVHIPNQGVPYTEPISNLIEIDQFKIILL